MSSSTNFPPPSSSPLPPPSELPESSLAELPPPLPPPTLPPLSTSSPTPPPSTLGKCQKHCAKLATPPHPLVTAQALQGVKLRSVKKQEGQLTSTGLVTAASADATLNNQAGMLSASANHANTSHHLPSKEACPDCAVANARFDGMTSTDGKLAGPGSHSAVSSLSSSEATGSHDLARADAKQPGLKLDHDSCNLTQTMMRTPNNESTHASLQSPPDIVRNPANQRSPGSQGATEQERKERAMYAVLANSGHSSPGSHWEKTSYGTDKNHISKIIKLSSSQHQQARDTVLTDTVPTESAEKQWNTEDAGHKDTSYWTLSGTNRGSHRESKRMLSESKDEVDTDDKNSSEKWSHRAAGGDSTADTDANQSNSIFKPRGQGKLRSPEKPVPPKKPDLCILVSPEARRGQITAPPAHPGCTPLHTQHAPSLKHLACTSGETTTPDQSLTHTTSPPHSVSTPVDVTTHSPSSSPKMQKPPNLHSKTDLSVTSPRTTTPRSAPKNPGEEARGTSGTYGTLESTGASQTQSTTGTQGTCSTLGKSGASGATSTQTGRTDWHRAEILRTSADDERIFQKRMMRSSLAEDEEEDEKERVEQRGMNTTVMMMSSFTKKKDRAKKRRKRRVGRQLLMMSPKMELSPSSSTSLSSSSSSSSGDERDVVKDRIMPTEKVRMMTEVCDEESSDSESSCALNHHSRSSLCSTVSTGSLQGKLSLPHRLIQENEEERRGQEAQESKAAPGSKLGSLQSILPEQEALPIRHDVFLGVSADQMFVSGQPRTTEDLFAVIHRSKKKMLGRRASEEDRHCIMSSSSSSSSSLPVAPADPLPLLTKPAALTSQRSMRSESFKALLLKKGTRSDASSRISAVERLCRVSASASTTVSSLPPPADQPQHTPTGLYQDIDAHLTLDVPLPPTSLCTQNFPVTLRQRDLTQNHLLFTSSSPVFFLSSSSSMRPRSLTPPCFTSRRFAARCHLYVTPMTAISEGECEEEQEEDKAFETPGAEGELSPRLVEIS
uniref:Uncharacterized protein n=2 Tax=Monopterus albus TaxID=43700 RepID=A0A3Q3ISH2_MONAL